MRVVRTAVSLGLSILSACSNPADTTPDSGPLEDAAPTRHPGYCTAVSEYADPSAPRGRRQAYYAEGRLLTKDEFDSDDDGDVDVVASYFYDEELLVRWENDEFADGTMDELRKYEWDEEERMTRELWDLGADGTIDMTIRFEHDAEGRRSAGFGHRDDDNATDLQLRFEYDGDGNLVLLELDGLRGAPDGTPDRVIQHAYDEVGNQLASFFDLDADGVADLQVTYAYDCW